MAAVYTNIERPTTVIMRDMMVKGRVVIYEAVGGIFYWYQGWIREPMMRWRVCYCHDWIVDLVGELLKHGNLCMGGTHGAVARSSVRWKVFFSSVVQNVIASNTI